MDNKIEQEISEDPLSDMPCSSSIVECSTTQSDSHLDHKAVLLFLDECYENKKDLRNSKVRRRLIFTKIADNMKRHGYNFATPVLDKKLQNLKGTYNSILDNNNNSRKRIKRGRITWPYMEQMIAIYGNEEKKPPTIQSMPPMQPAGSEAIPSTSCYGKVDSLRKEMLSVEEKKEKLADVVPSTSCCNNDDTLRKEMLLIEEKKVNLVEDMLVELREIRKLRKEKLELDRERLNFDRENAAR